MSGGSARACAGPAGWAARAAAAGRQAAERWGGPSSSAGLPGRGPHLHDEVGRAGVVDEARHVARLRREERQAVWAHAWPAQCSGSSGSSSCSRVALQSCALMQPSPQSPAPAHAPARPPPGAAPPEPPAPPAPPRPPPPAAHPHGVDDQVLPLQLRRQRRHQLRPKLLRLLRVGLDLCGGFREAAGRAVSASETQSRRRRKDSAPAAVVCGVCWGVRGPGQSKPLRSPARHIRPRPQPSPTQTPSPRSPAASRWKWLRSYR
jgi:hypothetical protein